MNRIIEAGVRTLARTRALDLLQPLMRGTGTVLMLHRFKEPACDHSGFDPSVLDRQLAWLRGNGYTFLSLAGAIRDLLAGEPLPARSVIATVDDGYADFARAGLDVFCRHDCPVTVFLVSGFVDGDLWLWWDKLEYACLASPRSQATFDVAGRQWTLALTDPPARRAAAAALAEALKCVPDADRAAAVPAVAQALDVALPETPPVAYQPMTWDQVRQAEARGADFGPHTVTHPILSRTDDPRAAHEIAQSWRRVQAEAARPVPVFCYPNGDPLSFAAREMRLVEKFGMAAALSTTPGHVNQHGFVARRWRIPRFSWPRSLSGLIQVVSGLERVKMLLRGEERL